MLGQMRREEGCGKVYKLVQSALGTLCSYNLTMVFINQTNNKIYVQNHKNPTILFFLYFLSTLVRSVTDCVQLGVAVSKRRTDDQGPGCKTWKGKKSKSQESSKLHTQTNWIVAIKLDVNLWCNHIR